MHRHVPPGRIRLTARGYLAVIGVAFVLFEAVQLFRSSASLPAASPLPGTRIPVAPEAVKPLPPKPAPRIEEPKTLAQKKLTVPPTRAQKGTAVSSEPVSTFPAATVADKPLSPFSRLQSGEEMQMEHVTDDSFCFSVATVPRPWYKDGAMPELKYIQMSSIVSWSNAGAGEILWLTENDGDYDVGKLNLNESVSQRCREVPGLEAEMGHIPLISSAFKLADSSAKCEFVVFMNTDIVVLPSFGAVLKSVVRSMSDVQRFLFIGHRLRLAIKPQDISEVVLTGSEQQMQERFVVGAGQPNPHATDVFVWRRGSYQDVPIPPFLIGRNIWDLWLWSYAVRNWKTIQGGNVFFVFHPDHAKPHQNIAEYQSNIERANRDRSQPVSCSNIDCAEYFLYAGKCRPVSSGTASWLGKEFCLRRKREGARFPPPPEEKLPLSFFKFEKIGPRGQ